MFFETPYTFTKSWFINVLKRNVNNCFTYKQFFQVLKLNFKLYQTFKQLIKFENICIKFNIIKPYLAFNIKGNWFLYF